MGKTSMKKKTIFKGNDNPFNVKINREKHCILGKKVKGTKGLYGISQARSLAKRKEFFHQKRNFLSKANNFVDKRLMNGDSQEEVAVTRLVEERKKRFKKNIFNLNDEDILTHGGIPLNDIQTFDKRDVESDDEETLSASYIRKAHFGNFDTEKSGDKPLTHKEVIDQLIVETKKKRQEKKIEKDLTEELIDQLDQDWKSFHATTKIKADIPEPLPLKSDRYDIFTQQLKFSGRGTASTRTKTNEEIEAEEQQKMSKLEEERFKRMLDEGSKHVRLGEHVSADSLCDDYSFEPLLETNNFSVTKQKSEETDSGDNFGPNHESDTEGNEAESDDERIDKNVESESIHSDALQDNNISFKIPESIQELEKFMNVHDCTPEMVHESMEELLKPFLNSKSEKKLKSLAMLFGALIEYAFKFLKSNPSISANIAPTLYNIVEISPLKSAEVFLS